MWSSSATPRDPLRDASATAASTSAVCVMSSTFVASLEVPSRRMCPKSYFNGTRSINPDEALPFFVAGRHPAVHGVGDSWWCDDEADRA